MASWQGHDRRVEYTGRRARWLSPPANRCRPAGLRATLETGWRRKNERYRFLVDGPRGRLPGPYKVWAHNPKPLHAAAPLGEHFTPDQSSLTERERAIAVLVITSRWHSAYPTAAHERRGKEVGLPAALGHERITDVIVLMGYYTAVSLTMNFYAVPAGSPGLTR